MRLLGFEISRTKAVPANTSAVYDNPNAWWPVIREPFAGAWQRNMEERPESALTYYAVARCISLVSSDIAKMRMKLVAQSDGDIWTEVESPSFSPVLRKPNRYQNRIQFYQQWVESKLCSGNTYVLKERDNRGIVTRLYVLDPTRVVPLVAPDGSVYYRLTRNDLAGLHDDMDILDAVPASEIIHDRFNTLHHPLIGTSPIYACAMAAMQGMKIQRNSERFFANFSAPGGILTAPASIPPPVADRIKEHWEANYSGGNVGRVAVLGDGLKYESMAFNATDSQLIEQLKWTAEAVCTSFGVPAYKIGVGAPPAYNNIEALDAQYYAQCLQILIESIELCLDEGLGLDATKDGVRYGTEFDLDNLLRMDTATQVKTLSEGVLGGIIKPDEARRKLGYGPTPGGNAVYLQQQNFSLQALAKRDAQDDPFATEPAASAPSPPTETDDDEAMADKAVFAAALLRKELGLAA